MVDLAFDANPRSAKRFVNALTLLLRILDRREVAAEPHLVAAVLAGELRWPEQFSDVRTAVRSADTDPLAGIRQSDDDRLSEFVSRFVPGDIDLLSLDSILRLTATVAGSAEVEYDEEILTGRVAENMPILIAGLEQMGYARSARSDKLYYHEMAPGIRFRMGKIVVRLERYSGLASGRDWQLEKSFSLAREVALALDAARSNVEEA
jgi:hypothetical protein